MLGNQRLHQALKLALLMGSLFVGLIGYYKITGNLYLRSYGWIRQSQEITQDTGRILRITPAREKQCSCAFTDGCSCYLVLQVEGENGTGIVEMGNVFVEFPVTDLYFFGASWEWKGETKRISQGCWSPPREPSCESGVAFW